MSHSPPSLKARGALCALLAATIALLASGCPRSPKGWNVVIITIEGLRADRLTGPAPSPDPMSSVREWALKEGEIHRALASSSEALPSQVSIFTGVSPAAHGTLVEQYDRLPAERPTLAQTFTTAGYRTAGFPSLLTLGLGSGLSRGFETYGWSPFDVIRPGNLAETNELGWNPEAGRRPGQMTIADALAWAGRHKEEKLFLWVHLSEASPPYATDRSLIDAFNGSLYDAALAYDSTCAMTLVQGFKQLGIDERTIFVISGNHGESLGAHGESFHGLNLYPPSLATAVVLVGPKGGAKRAGGDASAEPPGRLMDLFATVLDLAGVAVPGGVEAKAGRPAISHDAPLLAVTLGPRTAFGWDGRLAYTEGDRIWYGPSGDEVGPLLEGPGTPGAGATAPDPAAASALRERALGLAGPIVKRLKGRSSAPSIEDRVKIVALLRKAGDAREMSDKDSEVGALREAWKLDPGNFEVAAWLSQAVGAKAPDRAAFAKDVESHGEGMPEALMTLARLKQADAGPDGPPPEAFELNRKACDAGAGAGCTIDVAMRLGHAGHFEEATQTLAPVAEKSNDPDVWRTLGDLYFAAENTYRASQAFEKAVALRPRDADLLVRQGDCLAAVKDYDKAKAKYEAARKVIPTLGLVELRLGSLARQQGDRPAAVEHFRKGLGADTNTVKGAISLGRLLAQQGMAQEAIPILLDAAGRDPSASDALYAAAEVLAGEGRLDEAEKYLNQCLERDPTNAGALYQLARLQAYRGNRRGANETLQKLAQHGSKDIALAALRDPLFTNDAPDAPLAKGMQALYDLIKRSLAAAQRMPGAGAGATNAPKAAAPTGRP